jgi:hypothetical protein
MSIRRRDETIPAGATSETNRDRNRDRVLLRDYPWHISP